jgi:hypothetical protein
MEKNLEVFYEDRTEVSLDKKRRGPQGMRKPACPALFFIKKTNIGDRQSINACPL